MTRRNFLIALGGIAVATAIGVLWEYERPTSPPPPIRPQKLPSTRFVEIKALKQNGNWTLTNHTPDDVISLLANWLKPCSLFSFLEGSQDGSLVLANGMTLDNYLLSVRSAAGGDIITELNLDYYNFQGPQTFFAVSASHLNLQAVSQGSRAVVLGSWDTFSRRQSQATIVSVLSQLESQGWKVLIPDDLSFFSDFGYAGYSVNGTVIDSANSPYCFADAAVIANVAQQEPYLLGHFNKFASQARVCPQQSQIDQFLSLAPDQQVTALTSLAQLQKSQSYTEVYPIIINGSGGSCNPLPTWDATAALQPNGAPFLDLIVNLLSSYS